MLLVDRVAEQPGGDHEAAVLRHDELETTVLEPGPGSDSPGPRVDHTSEVRSTRVVHVTVRPCP
jgi:hypothetical protein